MEKKDYFSRQSKEYAAFRPTYPEALYQFIFKHLQKKECAWDCATGNGQVAFYLASHFDSVYATDVSRPQLDHALPANNIFYSVAAAEQTNLPDNRFDLITVAQALHWFSLPEFYSEVRRTGRSGGLIAVWGYGLLSVDAGIDELFMDFYERKTGPYWDDARKHVENHYNNLSFPFPEISCPEFSITAQWTPRQFEGYLTSWSATQKYILRHGSNPVDNLMKSIQPLWKDGTVKQVTFPLFMKLGRI